MNCQSGTNTVLCGVKILVSTAIDSIDIDHGLLDGDDIIKHQTGSWCCSPPAMKAGSSKK